MSKVALPSEVHRRMGSLDAHSSVLNPIRPFSITSTAQWPSLDLGWSGSHLFNLSMVPSAQRHTELVCVSFNPTINLVPLLLKDMSKISRHWLLIDCLHNILRAELWVCNSRYFIAYSYELTVACFTKDVVFSVPLFQIYLDMYPEFQRSMSPLTLFSITKIESTSSLLDCPDLLDCNANLSDALAFKSFESLTSQVINISVHRRLLYIEYSTWIYPCCPLFSVKYPFEYLCYNQWLRTSRNKVRVPIVPNC